MKLSNIKYIGIAMLLIGFVSCNNDDDQVMTVDDVVMTDDTDGTPEDLDFSGTFIQEDQMGRPGINTVLNGTADLKNAFNVTIPSEQTAAFQPSFLESCCLARGIWC